MIKSNEKEFIRNWHQHKVALTRENTRIKQPIRDEEITYDQSDISHLASGLPSGIDNLVRNGSYSMRYTPVLLGQYNFSQMCEQSRDHKKRLIKEREDKRISQSPSAPEFLQQSIPSQPILHQTLSYG